jgi:hypothetical protein
MHRVAIGYSTCEKLELSERTIRPLLNQPFDLFWADGSKSEAGVAFPHTHGIPPNGFIFNNVGGGSAAAVVFLLSKMLEGPYDYIGLVEADVLLPDGWFAPTFELF